MRSRKRNGDNLPRAIPPSLAAHVDANRSETSFDETLDATFGEFAILKATAGS
jgi:hypothetical protein